LLDVLVPEEVPEEVLEEVPEEALPASLDLPPDELFSLAPELLDPESPLPELPDEESLLLPLWSTFFFDPVLKSVSYQPDPLSLKAAAETIFFNAGLLHFGQITGASSESFMSFSIRCWHSSH
jgi:hypothetical protein